MATAASSHGPAQVAADSAVETQAGQGTETMPPVSTVPAVTAAYIPSAAEVPGAAVEAMDQEQAMPTAVESTETRPGDSMQAVVPAPQVYELRCKRCKSTNVDLFVKMCTCSPACLTKQPSFTALAAQPAPAPLKSHVQPQRYAFAPSSQPGSYIPQPASGVPSPVLSPMPAQQAWRTPHPAVQVAQTSPPTSYVPQPSSGVTSPVLAPMPAQQVRQTPHPVAQVAQTSPPASYVPQPSSGVTPPVLAPMPAQQAWQTPHPVVQVAQTSPPPSYVPQPPSGVTSPVPMPAQQVSQTPYAAVPVSQVSMQPVYAPYGQPMPAATALPEAVVAAGEQAKKVMSGARKVRGPKPCC